MQKEYSQDQREAGLNFLKCMLLECDRPDEYQSRGVILASLHKEGYIHVYSWILNLLKYLPPEITVRLLDLKQDYE